jgi:hypothetical protein
MCLQVTLAMRWVETTINKLLRSTKLSCILETAGGCCQR